MDMFEKIRREEKMFNLEKNFIVLDIKLAEYLVDTEYLEVLNTRDNKEKNNFLMRLYMKESYENRTIRQPIDNTLLFGVVRNNKVYCVLVNELVRTINGNTMHVADLLQHYRFNLSEKGTRVVLHAGLRKYIKNSIVKNYGVDASLIRAKATIEEVIFNSIYQIPLIKGNGLENHHEVAVFDHRFGYCNILSKEQHKKRHSQVGNYSRRIGEKCESYEDILSIIKRCNIIYSQLPPYLDN